MDYVDLLNGAAGREDIIREFYLDSESLLLQCHNDNELETAAGRILQELGDISVDGLVDILDDGTNVRSFITAQNIAQFSNIDAVDTVLSVVDANSGSADLDYRLIGYYFNKTAKVGAQTKYGENHYKAAMLMGLTTENKPFKLTALGCAYMMLPKAVKEDVRAKLFLKMPIIRVVMGECRNSSVDVSRLMRGILSETTVKRRLSNIKRLLLMLIEKSSRKNAYTRNIIWK